LNALALGTKTPAEAKKKGNRLIHQVFFLKRLKIKHGMRNIHQCPVEKVLKTP